MHWPVSIASDKIAWHLVEARIEEFRKACNYHPNHSYVRTLRRIVSADRGYDQPSLNFIMVTQPQPFDCSWKWGN